MSLFGRFIAPFFAVAAAFPLFAQDFVPAEVQVASYDVELVMEDEKDHLFSTTQQQLIRVERQLFLNEDLVLSRWAISEDDRYLHLQTHKIEPIDGESLYHAKVYLSGDHLVVITSNRILRMTFDAQGVLEADGEWDIPSGLDWNHSNMTLTDSGVLLELTWDGQQEVIRVIETPPGLDAQTAASLLLPDAESVGHNYPPSLFVDGEYVAVWDGFNFNLIRVENGLLFHEGHAKTERYTQDWRGTIEDQIRPTAGALDSANGHFYFVDDKRVSRLELANLSASLLNPEVLYEYPFGYEHIELDVDSFRLSPTRDKLAAFGYISYSVSETLIDGFVIGLDPDGLFSYAHLVDEDSEDWPDLYRSGPHPDPIFNHSGDMMAGRYLIKFDGTGTSYVDGLTGESPKAQSSLAASEVLTLERGHWAAVFSGGFERWRLNSAQQLAPKGKISLEIPELEHSDPSLFTPTSIILLNDTRLLALDRTGMLHAFTLEEDVETDHQMHSLSQGALFNLDDEDFVVLGTQSQRCAFVNSVLTCQPLDAPADWRILANVAWQVNDYFLVDALSAEGHPHLLSFQLDGQSLTLAGELQCKTQCAMGVTFDKASRRGLIPGHDELQHFTLQQDGGLIEQGEITLPQLIFSSPRQITNGLLSFKDEYYVWSLNSLRLQLDYTEVNSSLRELVSSTPDPEGLMLAVSGAGDNQFVGVYRPNEEICLPIEVHKYGEIDKSSYLNGDDHLTIFQNETADVDLTETFTDCLGQPVESMQYDFSSVPEWLIAGEGVLSGVVSKDRIYRDESFVVYYTATNKGQRSERALHINLININDAPEPTQLIEAQTLDIDSYYIAGPLEEYFSDPDRDSLTFAVQGLPPGMVAGANFIEGVPTEAGSYEMVITATDPQGLSGSLVFPVEVVGESSADGRIGEGSESGGGGGGSLQWWWVMLLTSLSLIRRRRHLVQ